MALDFRLFVFNTTEPKRIAFENDTLMGVRAPVGNFNVAHTDCCIGRGLAATHSKSNHQSFVFYTMFSLKKQLDVFNGEGTVFGSINRNSLNNTPIIHKELIISPHYRQVMVDGKPLTLTRKEFDLLHYLASSPGRIFTREQLYNHVSHDRPAVAVDEWEI